MATRGTTDLISDKGALRAQLKRDSKGVPITVLPATASAYKIGHRGHVVSKRSGKPTSFGQDFQ